MSLGGENMNKEQTSHLIVNSTGCNAKSFNSVTPNPHGIQKTPIYKMKEMEVKRMSKFEIVRLLCLFYTTR